MKNTRRVLRLLAMLLVFATGASLSADRVKLRSGKVIEGMFIGADSKSVRVLLEDGQVSEVPIANAVALEFSAREPASCHRQQRSRPPSQPWQRLPPRLRAAKVVTVPAGTPINVRLTQAIDVDGSLTGMKFKGLVDDPVMIGGSIAIPRGASAMLQAVTVEQSGKMKGSDKITLKLNAVGFAGMVHEVATTYVESKGKGEGKKPAARSPAAPGSAPSSEGSPAAARARRLARRWWRDRRGGVGWRRGASEAAGRNTPAVSADCGGQHPVVSAGSDSRFQTVLVRYSRASSDIPESTRNSGGDESPRLVFLTTRVVRRRYFTSRVAGR